MSFKRNAQGVARVNADLERAGEDALRDQQRVAQTQAPRRTGEFAGSIQVTWNGKRGGLSTNLPQGGAVERGANVGHRRGPHMQGAHTIQRAGDGWEQRVAQRLRGS